MREFVGEHAALTGTELTRSCAAILQVPAAAVTVFDVEKGGAVFASGRRVAELEKLQLTLMQGPCQDAYYGRKPLHLARLDNSSAARWPLFDRRARHCGVRALSAYPLIAGYCRVGVLMVYRTEEGELTSTQDEVALAMADAFAAALLR